MIARRMYHNHIFQVVYLIFYFCPLQFHSRILPLQSDFLLLERGHLFALPLPTLVRCDTVPLEERPAFFLRFDSGKGPLFPPAFMT
jgi:hypothetical protein